MPRPKKKVSEKLTNQTKAGQVPLLVEAFPSESNSSIHSGHDSLHDSEYSKLTSSGLESSIEDDDFEESDMFPDPKTIYILRGGILKRQNNWKMKKNDWHYRIMDTTGEVMLVNYDLHDAVPFVKTILNETVDFPEMVLLERIQKLVFALIAIGILLIIVGLRGVTGSLFNEKIDILEKKFTTQPVQKIQENIPSLLQIKQSTGSTQQF